MSSYTVLAILDLLSLSERRQPRTTVDSDQAAMRVPSHAPCWALTQKLQRAMCRVVDLATAFFGAFFWLLADGAGGTSRTLSPSRGSVSPILPVGLPSPCGSDGAGWPRRRGRA